MPEIDAHILEVGDVCRWARSARRFVVTRKNMDHVYGQYLDTGETFHTHGFQNILKIQIDWWMGVIHRW